MPRKDPLNSENSWLHEEVSSHWKSFTSSILPPAPPPAHSPCASTGCPLLWPTLQALPQSAQMARVSNFIINMHCSKHFTKMLTYNPQKPNRVGASVTVILQMMKPRGREVDWLAQGHSAGKSRAWVWTSLWVPDYHTASEGRSPHPAPGGRFSNFLLSITRQVKERQGEKQRCEHKPRQV